MATKDLKKKHSEKLKANEEKSYETYIAEEGERAEESYYDSVRLAKTKMSLGDTNYGAMASELAALGLSGSGYEDYLKGKAEKSCEASLAEAERRRSEGEYRNRASYEKYLSDYDALQSKIAAGVISSIGSGGSFDFESAYEKAVNAGLSHELAFTSATEGVSLAKRNAYEQAVTFAKLNNLSPARAKKYAESLGLDERMAEMVFEEISTFTKGEMSYLSSMSADAYYNYIMSQSKNN